MTAVVLNSPRVRRRLAWTGALAGAAVVLAVVVASMPTHSDRIARAPVVDAPAQVVRTPRTVPPPRAALNALLDRFVPDVIARRDLAAGWSLVTRDARGSRADWLRGDTPFQHYAAKVGTYHGWRVNYSYPDDVGFDVFLAPARPGMISYAFRGEAKKAGGRWRIAVFYPQAAFQPAGRRQLVHADTDLQPSPLSAAETTRARLSAAWLLVPAGALGAVAAGALAFALVRALRRRGRIRELERELALLR